jgi:hypothetical protein
MSESHCEFPWRMTSSGMLHRVALVRTDVSEEPIASIIRVTRIGELGTLIDEMNSDVWGAEVFTDCIWGFSTRVIFKKQFPSFIFIEVLHLSFQHKNSHFIQLSGRFYVHATSYHPIHIPCSFSWDKAVGNGKLITHFSLVPRSWNV